MRRLYGFILLLTLVFGVQVFSQQRWERNYGGTGDDEGQSVQQTSDGGYIVAGWTNSFGAGYNVYLIKTDASGDTLWTRLYGGGTLGDHGFSVMQTSDGGYIVAGVTDSWGYGSQFYLVKTNASGDTLWTRSYGGGTENDIARSVQQTSDGGYIIAGYSAGNVRKVHLIKTNASGDTLWARTYGEASFNYVYSVRQTSDGGYIIAGSTDLNSGPLDVYLIKTNASGDTLWTRTYGGTNADGGSSVQQTSDGGYIVAGFTTSFGDTVNGDVYLIKTNVSGDTLWTRTYGGASYDFGYSVQQTSDGGYIITGVTCSYGDTSGDVYLIKTNTSGDTLWTRTYGGTSADKGNSVQQTSDGGYIVAGYTNSFGDGYQVYLIKTDANGNSGVEETTEVRSRKIEIRITATPNPFTSFTTVPGHSSDRFALYNVSGRRVGVYRGDRIGEGLVPGVYFLAPEGGKAKPARVVKVR